MSQSPCRVILVCLALSVLVGEACAQEKRLDYRQEQALKDARYYLDQAEGIAKALEEKIKDWKVGDTSIQIGTVQNYLASKDKASQYLKNAADRFKQLPVGHSEVRPVADRYQPLVDSLSASETKLNAVHAGLKSVVEQGAGAGYKADFDRLREINAMYSNPRILQEQPERAIDVIKQISAVKAERQRIAEKYGDLLKQSTPQSRDMNGVLRYFDQQFGAFEQATQKYAAEAPAQIKKNLEDALKMAADAVAHKRHLYFGEGGGVNQQLSFARTRCSVLAAIAPNTPETTAAEQAIADATSQVKQMKASLNDAIIESNDLPNSSYAGPDKVELIGIVKTKWADSGVAGEVLTVGINSANWQRETRWEWRAGAWHKVDYSKIQGHVIVKADEKLANVHYINITKDHLAQDAIKAYFFNDPKAEVEVGDKVLLAKVK